MNLIVILLLVIFMAFGIWIKMEDLTQTLTLSVSILLLVLLEREILNTLLSAIKDKRIIFRNYSGFWKGDREFCLKDNRYSFITVLLFNLILSLVLLGLIIGCFYKIVQSPDYVNLYTHQISNTQKQLIFSNNINLSITLPNFWLTPKNNSSIKPNEVVKLENKVGNASIYISIIKIPSRNQLCPSAALTEDVQEDWKYNTQIGLIEGEYLWEWNTNGTIEKIIGKCNKTPLFFCYKSYPRNWSEVDQYRHEFNEIIEGIKC